MKEISKQVRQGLIVFFLIVATLSTLHLARWALESYNSSKTQQELQDLYHQGSISDEPTDEPDEEPGNQTDDQTEPVPGESGEQQNNPPTPAGPKPDGGTKPPALQMLPEYRALYEKNSDIVGWLDIGDGLFSTPVMQRDNEYYLKHNFYGEEDKHGQVFLDERNSKELGDDNTILYGHNIPSDRSMFNVLTNYKDPDFVKQHPVIKLNTLYHKYSYAVSAVYIAATDPEHGELFDYINYLKFSTRDAKEAYIAQINKRSLIDTGVRMNADDRILTLSTCTYEFSDARLVVVARRLRDGEKPEDFGKNIVKREDPLMPEIWTKLFG